MKLRLRTAPHFNRTTPVPYKCLIFLTFLFDKISLTSKKNNKYLFYFNYVFYATIVTQLAFNLISVYTKNTELFYIQFFTAYFNITTFINYNFVIFTNEKREKMVAFMQKHFISTHPLYNKCIRNEVRFSVIIGMLFILSSFAWYVTPWFSPATDEEMQVYNFSNPSRRFSTQFWAPFDVTASPYYEIFFPFTLYSTFMVGVLSLELFTTLPILGLHVKAQFDILSEYLTLLGHPDILSINIKTGHITRHNEITRYDNRLKIQQAKSFLLQIVQQHQHILTFVKTFERNNQIFFAFRMLLTITLLLGVLCQYVFTNSQRAYIFFNLIIVMQFNFFLCTCSELINSGYYGVHKSSYNNYWYNLVFSGNGFTRTLDKDIRRYLMMIMHSSPKSKYLKFKHLGIGFQTFVGSIRLTYSLFVFLFYVQK
ncbi:hypothetical protein M8J75_005492 [Diaphorina citri]|nr:hypothetical protein M8J75_005492 [Diaphorina citri]